MNKLKYFLTTLILAFIIMSCESNEEVKETSNETGVTVSPDLAEIQSAEEYISEINNANLNTGKSLYYSKSDGSTVEVEVFVDTTGKIVKLIEEYSRSEQGSIETNAFYYKDEMMYASKERFEEGEGMDGFFVERVTYYDDNGAAKISKRRQAQYEDGLTNEMFEIVASKACSDDRAFRVLNQEGEFQTTFQGFIKDEHLIYLIVGENKKDGYASTLVVQQKGPTIRKLMANEKSMIGTLLEVDFQKSIGDLGFEFQALLNIKII